MYMIDFSKFNSIALHQGLSPSGACKRAGIQCNSVTRWKTSGIRAGTLVRLAQALNCDPEDLIKEED